jgi:hypothetical protein
MSLTKYTLTLKVRCVTLEEFEIAGPETIERDQDKRRVVTVGERGWSITTPCIIILPHLI